MGRAHYLVIGILIISDLSLFGYIIWVFNPKYPERLNRLHRWFFGD